jgi:hypothetical protein
MNIQGEPAPGHSTADAMRAFEEIVAKLPPGVGYDYTGVSYQERMASTQTAPALCLLHSGYLSVSGRALRKLAHPRLDSTRVAARRAGWRDRLLAARTAQ